MCLSASNTPGQYYLRNLSRTLKYSKDPRDLITADTIQHDNVNDFGYKLTTDHSVENLHRVLPLSQRNVQWEVLTMMQMQNRHEIWLKAALLNCKTGRVALITSTNRKINLTRRKSRAVKTVDGTWFVGHYKMCAPIVFWKELQSRLLERLETTTTGALRPEEEKPVRPQYLITRILDGVIRLIITLTIAALSLVFMVCQHLFQRETRIVQKDEKKEPTPAIEPEPEPASTPAIEPVEPEPAELNEPDNDDTALEMITGLYLISSVLVLIYIYLA